MWQSKTFYTHDPNFRERMLDVAASPPDEICPFCGCLYEEGEFLHIDMGYCQQVTPSHCWECGAYELGCYELDPKTQTYYRGWVRERQPGDEDKYPAQPVPVTTMLIIPLSNGYMVTDGFSWVRTFADRESAIAFAFQMELYYPRMSILMRFPVKGTLYERHAWR